MTAPTPADLPAALRIVQLVQEFSTAGGVETVAVELQAQWERGGIESEVLAGSVGAEIDAERRRRVGLVWPRALLGWMPTRGRWRYIGRTLVVPTFTLAVTLAIWAGRRSGKWAENAVVVSHGDSLVADVIVLHMVNAASLAQKRRDGQWRWALNPMTWFVQARDRYMLGGMRARRYVAVSNGVVRDVAERHGIPAHRVTVIPNGTDIERFKPQGSIASLRDQFAIPQIAPLLLFAGHEFDRKGLAQIIHALTEPGCEAAHLVVVGSDDPDPYAKRASELGVSKRVHFAGSRRDMAEVYRAADAFVLPTAYETFSLVCMEALASGVPIFATRAGGIEDYLVDGVNGCFIGRDAVSIATVLGPFLADSDRRAAMGKAARETALRFAWPEVARRYHELLTEVRLEKQRA